MQPRTFARHLEPDFRGLPRPFWVLLAGTLVNRVGGFVLVFLAIYLPDVRGLTPTQAGAVLSVYGLLALTPVLLVWQVNRARRRTRW